MFRSELVGDKHPRNFTFFFSPTSKNYYEFVNLLDKYLSENINKSFFEGKVELEELKPLGDDKYERVQKGTLRLLSEWLNSSFSYKDENTSNEIVRPLKKVRNERQKPAHKVIENEYDPEYINKQKELMENCYLSVGSIRRNIQTHPMASSVELLERLDKDNVKYF